jgi:hypothetical protein
VDLNMGGSFVIVVRGVARKDVMGLGIISLMID